MQQNPVFSRLSLIIGHMFTTLSKLISKVFQQFTFFFSEEKMIPEFQLSTIKMILSRITLTSVPLSHLSYLKTVHE